MGSFGRGRRNLNPVRRCASEAGSADGRMSVSRDAAAEPGAGQGVPCACPCGSEAARTGAERRPYRRFLTAVNEAGPLRPHIRRLANIGTIAFALGAAACEQGIPADLVEAERDTAGSLAGYWRWVASERGGEVVTPSRRADSVVFKLGPYGGYLERTGDALLQSRYWFASGRLNQLQDTTFVVLLMDTSAFFPLSVETYHGAAVRAFDGDSLVLSGTGSDASLHIFIRVVPRSVAADSGSRADRRRSNAP